MTNGKKAIIVFCVLIAINVAIICYCLIKSDIVEKQPPYEPEYTQFEYTSPKGDYSLIAKVYDFEFIYDNPPYENNNHYVDFSISKNKVDTGYCITKIYNDNDDAIDLDVDWTDDGATVILNGDNQSSQKTVIKWSDLTINNSTQDEI